MSSGALPSPVREAWLWRGILADVPSDDRTTTLHATLDRNAYLRGSVDQGCSETHSGRVGPRVNVFGGGLNDFIRTRFLFGQLLVSWGRTLVECIV